MLTKLYLRTRTMIEDQEGATAVEYGLMVAGIAMLIVVAVWALGDNLSDLFDSVSTQLGAL